MSLSRNQSDGPSLSLPSSLAVLLGGGMLFVLWKFDFLFEELSETTRMLIVAGSTVLLVWGGMRTVADFTSRAPRREYRFLRHRVFLPRPGQFYLAIMIAVFSGALLGRSNMLMLVFSMMAGPFVVNGWITYSMLKRTSASRTVLPRVMAGEPMTVELGLSNRKRLMSCWLMSVRDRIQNTEERLEPSVLFARVPPGGRRSGHYHVRLMRRGRYSFGPMHLTARFPLGIVERGLMFESTDQVLVYPRIGRLSSRWMREHFQASDPVERRELRQGAFDDEFHRIREFRWGDNPRAIHWRSSARHNALMVREYRQSRDLDLAVLTDFWLPNNPTVEPLERLELAASVAATICITHMKESRDSTLRLAIAGRSFVNWEGESRIFNAEGLLDHFALAEGSSEPDLRRMFSHLGGKRTGQTRTVLLTTRKSGTPEWNRLERALAEGMAERAGPVELVEADPGKLSSIFEYD